MGTKEVLLLLSVLFGAVHGKKDCCKLSGNGNYHQFDKGPMVHFRSNCTYNFASDINGAFQVWVDTEFHHDNPAVSFANATIIHYKNETYILTVDDVIMPDGMKSAILGFQTYENGIIKIEHIGQNIKFTLYQENLELFWHGAHNLEVCLDNRWSQNPSTMNGLCGNYNGNKYDDLVTSGGYEVPNNFEGYDTFGESWAVDWQDETDCNAGAGGTTTPSTPVTTTPIPDVVTVPRCCYARGDPHYGQTDGGRRVNYQGVCTYNLQSAKDDTFKVWVENEHRRGNTRVSWTKLVIIHYAGVEYILDKTTVSVGGSVFPITNPFTPIYDGDVVIERVGRYIILTITTENVVVTWNRRSYVRVCLGPEWYDRTGIVNGICGNNNGDPNDDLVTSGGITVPANRQGQKEFGDSWNVTECVPDPLVEENCTIDVLLEAADDSRCGQIIDVSGPYASCLADIQAEDFYMGCEFDVCALYGDDVAILEAVCEHLLVLQDVCEKLGHQVGDWWTAAGCESTTTTTPTPTPTPTPPTGYCCKLSGNGNYKQFDNGPMVHFRSNCTYNFATDENGAFKVWVDTEFHQDNPAVSFANAAIIHYNDTTYVLTVDEVIMPGSTSSISGFQTYDDGTIRIESIGQNIVFTIKPEDVRIFWHGGYNLEVCLGDQNAMHGLCGNNNGDSTDDLVTSAGSPVSNDMAGHHIFGESYAVQWADETDCPRPWGFCSVVLDPHGNSTDGAEFKVTDVCTYDLALYDANLNVAMETYRRNVIDERRGVSFVKRLIIQHNGVEYSMYPNSLNVGNGVVNSDANFDCNFGKYKFCCVSRKTQFKVCSDRKLSFYLYYGPYFNNALSGLCGNFNGDPSDDYLLRGGGAANGMEDFVKSWERPNCQ